MKLSGSWTENTKVQGSKMIKFNCGDNWSNYVESQLTPGQAAPLQQASQLTRWTQWLGDCGDPSRDNLCTGPRWCHGHTGHTGHSWGVWSQQPGHQTAGRHRGEPHQYPHPLYLPPTTWPIRGAHPPGTPAIIGHPPFNRWLRQVQQQRLNYSCPVPHN